MSEERRRPTDRASWDQRYTDGDLPWDTGTVDSHLREVMTRHGIRSGKALDIGCGTGTNAIWLAQQGFQVTGLDLSPTAIDRAKAKAEAVNVHCDLIVRDFLVDEVPGAPFDFIYDRGCFHVFDGDDERARFAARVATLLAPAGIWHSLLGSTDGPPRDSGPPRRSAATIISVVEPHFEILALESTVFDGDRLSDARAWVLVARRRVAYPS